MSLNVEPAGPLVPVTPDQTPPVAGPAIPVIGYTTQPPGQVVQAGPAMPVYVVAVAELGAFGLQAGPAIPMVLASAVGVALRTGQRPIPVYVVAGSLNPAPAGAFRITESGVRRITEAGARRITE